MGKTPDLDGIFGSAARHAYRVQSSVVGGNTRLAQIGYDHLGRGQPLEMPLIRKLNGPREAELNSEAVSRNICLTSSSYNHYDSAENEENSYGNIPDPCRRPQGLEGIAQAGV